MMILDAHQDIGFNALAFNRSYLEPLASTWQREAKLDKPNGTATVSLPDGLQAGVGIVFSTLFTAPKTRDPALWDRFQYDSPAAAYKLALQQYDYYERIIEADERLQWIRTQADLEAVVATWADFTLPAPITDPEEAAEAAEAARRAEPEPPASPRDPDEPVAIPPQRQGLVLLIENADSILEPAQFDEWFARGVRVVGPAWNATRYSGGTHAPGPLTDLGRELLDVMADLGAILDLSHMAEEAYLEAVERYDGTVIASHSNPRHFCNTDRHLSDTMIRLLAERDGVIGVVLYNAFLSNNWRSGDPRRDIPLATVLDVIDYICQLTGSAAHVGIGTDFDGGFGVESIPDGLNSIRDLPKIAAGLAARGYDQADIEAIMSGNMLRKLRAALPTG